MSDALKRLRKTIYLTALAGQMKAAHLASSFSALEILYSLFAKGVVRFRADDPSWEGRDRVLLSKGHAGLALYAVMAEVGIIPRRELATFCRPGTRLGAEPNVALLPAVETTAGSLGHALSYAVGVALALKKKGSASRVFVLLGDGECEEGTIWEAVMSAHHHRLDNLTVILDFNGIQKMGPVRETMDIESWTERFGAFGWHVRECNGHDCDALAEALSIRSPDGLPEVLVARTVKGKGVTFMENDPDWHYRMPNRRETRKLMSELEITEEEVEHAARILDGAV